MERHWTFQDDPEWWCLLMLSRIDEANFELLPNVHFWCVLLDENAHSERFWHDSELKWIFSAHSELKFPVLQQGHMRCLAQDAMMKNELKYMIC